MLNKQIGILCFLQYIFVLRKNWKKLLREYSSFSSDCLFWYELFYKNIVVIHRVDNAFLFNFDICLKFTLLTAISTMKKWVTFLRLNIQQKILNIFKISKIFITNQEIYWTPFLKIKPIKTWAKTITSLIQFIYLFIQFIYLFIKFIYLFIPFIYLFIYLFVYLFIYLFIYSFFIYTWPG